MIRADRLSKRFGPVSAVEDLSFEVAAGEILGFLGPNGAGKSTTLRMLSGYWPPSSGAAAIAGLDLAQSSLAARRRLGYLPEAFAAPPELRVSEYLRFRAGLKGLAGRERRARVQEVAQQLGLTERLRQTCGSLSKGYRQRVGLADALLNRPPALLLDEPFTGLDPLQRVEFRDQLAQLAREGHAILFSSHVLPEVDALAERVLILHRGRCAALGSRAELIQAAREEAPLRVVTAGDGAALEQALLGLAAWRLLRREGGALTLQAQGAAERQSLFQWLAQRREPMLEFRVLEPSLEDLFRRLVGPQEPA
ncbi:MAG: ABC transporter ATP-binding protein [Planctomycetota bacterium]|nr:MAG: ABC transporter ATP-binding protein [Planctomycetota bacterium]